MVPRLVSFQVNWTCGGHDEAYDAHGGGIRGFTHMFDLVHSKLRIVISLEIFAVVD